MIIVILETEMFLLQSYYYFIQCDDKKLSVWLHTEIFEQFREHRVSQTSDWTLAQDQDLFPQQGCGSSAQQQVGPTCTLMELRPVNVLQ